MPRSNVEQLVVNSLLASQSRSRGANNITVVKIYCVSTRQSQIPSLIRVNQLSPNHKTSPRSDTANDLPPSRQHPLSEGGCCCIKATLSVSSSPPWPHHTSSNNENLLHNFFSFSFFFLSCSLGEINRRLMNQA